MPELKEFRFAPVTPDQRIHFLTKPDVTLFHVLDPERVPELPQCDLLNDCDHAEPARYRVWLANKSTSCTDLGCIGHPACAPCLARGRAREGFIVEAESWTP